MNTLSRGEEPEKIIDKWIPLYEEYKYNNETSVALKYLFWIRDIREGLGERKIFRCTPAYPHILPNVINSAHF